MDFSGDVLVRTENNLLQTYPCCAMLPLVMASPSPTNVAAAGSGPAAASPAHLRLDPAPSSVFSWLDWQADAPALLDEASGRTLRPAGPTLHARYRTTGMEMEAWPVSEEEARRIFQPGAEFDYSIGRAWSQIVMPHKSKRTVKSGERQETKKQRAEVEQRAGRRWLA